MQNFDVILEMDWLGENRALIDCKARKVIFRPLVGEIFECKGDTYSGVNRVITASKARKLYQEDLAVLTNLTKVNESNPIVGLISWL